MNFYNLILLLSVFQFINILSAAVDISPNNFSKLHTAYKPSDADKHFKEFIDKSQDLKKIFTKTVLAQIHGKDTGSEKFKASEKALEDALKNVDMLELAEIISVCSTTRSLDCLRNAVYNSLIKSLNVSNLEMFNHAKKAAKKIVFEFNKYE